MIVDGVLRQLGVKLTLVACSIRTIVVVDTVGDIGGLLDLSDEAACTDSVDTACGEEEDVTSIHFVFGQCLDDGTFFDTAHVVLGRRLYGEAAIELSPWSRIYDVPHLGLPEGIVTLQAEGIIGMHLDREVVAGIDELDEQGEATAKALEDALTDELFAVGMDQFVEVLPSEWASCDDGVIVVDVRDFPALTDLLIVGSKAFEWADSTAAPDDFLQERLEGQGI